MEKQKSSKKNVAHSVGLLPFAEAGWQNQVLKRIHQIRNQQELSLLKKIKHSFPISSSSGKKHKNPIDGSDVGYVYPIKQIKQLMHLLEKEPGSIDHRLHLVSIISKADQDYDLDVYKNLLLQSLTTLYLGDLGPIALKLAAKTYCNYLKKLCGYYKIQLLKKSSDRLMKVDYSKLDLRTLSEEVSPEYLKMIIDLRVAEALLEKTRGLEAAVQQKIRLPLKMEELNRLKGNTMDSESTSKPRIRASSKVDVAMARQSLFEGKRERSSKSETINLNVVLRKALAVVDITKSIPLFHPIGLKVIQKLKGVGAVDHLAFVMEGRIHMKAMQHYLMRIESGDESCQEAVTPTFNKAVVAYRSAMKHYMKKNVQKKDLASLVEYASLAHYAYVCHKSMKLTKAGLEALLKEGKKAIDAAVLIDPKYTAQQSQLIEDLNHLSGRHTEPID